MKQKYALGTLLCAPALGHHADVKRAGVFLKDRPRHRSPMVAPAGTPREIVAKLNSQAVAIRKSPDMQSRLTQQGGDAAPQSPEEFAAFIKTGMVKWAKVVKATGARSD